jgi:hypothetical protein
MKFSKIKPGMILKYSLSVGDPRRYNNKKNNVGQVIFKNKYFATIVGKCYRETIHWHDANKKGFEIHLL